MQKNTEMKVKEIIKSRKHKFTIVRKHKSIKKIKIQPY